MSRTRVFPREARSILTRTGGFLHGFTHTLQPYVGCEFSCSYCYVREMPVQKLNPYRLPWSDWISPKRNAVELLERAAERGKLDRARIFCSSSTDPYTPLERSLELTRGCLAVMGSHPPEALVLQTRSPLVTRDRELIARIPSVVVSVTIPTDDESVRRHFEPNSPSLAKRIETLAILRAAGIRTQAAVSPLLPCDPERLAEQLDAVADRVVIDDFFRGDGAGGRRSRAAIRQLRELGFERWSRPGYADAAVEIFRSRLGPGRVGISEQGFNDTGWLRQGPVRAEDASVREG
ncbi:MAG: radical SAM protein [Myxococcales bacterium]|nr:radical SAM protein [Myxococcales bacterium]